MARGSSGIKMPTEFEEALNQRFFKRLFVSERKQIAMIADEKSPARISHRIFATKSLRNGGKCENPYIKDFRIALCAAGVTKSLFIAKSNIHLTCDSSGIKMPAEWSIIWDRFRLKKMQAELKACA